MKINLLSFTDYELNISLYYKKNMDFFSYLLLKIITKEQKEDRVLKDILLDFDITEPIMYLFESAFYNLIDNKIVFSDEEDLSKVKQKNISYNALALDCLNNEYILVLEKEIIKNLCINPVSNEIVTKNDEYYDDYLVIKDLLTEDKIKEILNKNKNKIFSDSENYVFDVKIKEANPLISSYEIKNMIFDDNIKQIIFDNLQFSTKEPKKEYDKNLVILTKEYVLKDDENFDFIATLNNVNYGCDYYLITTNIGDIPMIKRTRIK